MANANGVAEVAPGSMAVADIRGYVRGFDQPDRSGISAKNWRTV